MERFKKTLKAALDASASVIHIFENEEIQTKFADGALSKLMELPPADSGWIHELNNFLFKDNLTDIAASKPVHGSLNIPSVGLLKVISSTKSGAKGVSLYFPGPGEGFFTSDWEQLISMHSNKSIETLEGVKQHHSNQADTSDDAFPTDMFAATDTHDHDTTEEQSDNQGDLFSVASYDDNPGEQDKDEDENHFMPGEFSPEPLNTDNSTYEPVAASNQVLDNQPSNQFVISAIQSEASSDNSAPKILFGNYDPSKSIQRDGDFPIDALLKNMMDKGASDMHLTLGQPVIFRIDGDLHRQGNEKISDSTMESLMLPIMPMINQEEFAEIYDTDFAYEVPGLGRFRVNMFKDNYGVGAVLRQIPATVLTADQLNLPNSIRKFCQLQKGLVLVTGPTGSGKSTTLAAMIDLINKSRPDHILTIEDPIEFVHSQQKCLVNQREVGKHTNSFKRALKAALREDPDIVLIGELRDLETIHIALETAETGHLVFGTLHTNTAVSTIDRIIDQFPSDQQSQIRTMVASSLKGVVAQTLVKKNGGGRIAAHEILVSNDAVANMIRESKNHMIENHMQTQKNDGNQLMNECLLMHVKSGAIDIKQAYLKSVDKASFIDNAKRASVNLGFLKELEQELAAS